MRWSEEVKIKQETERRNARIKELIEIIKAKQIVNMDYSNERAELNNLLKQK